MTDALKESLRFYTTNDYLLINALLRQESEARIEAFIRLINEDGRGVMKEAEEQGFSRRWKCTEEEGVKLYQAHKKRFPLITSQETFQEIIARAREDIDNMMSCLQPLEEDLILYRNVKSKYAEGLREGEIIDCKGFSSCSLQPHPAEIATYGSGGSVLWTINAAKGTPAIRLDQYPSVGNEPDEVILPPIRFQVEKLGKTGIEVCVEVFPIILETARLILRPWEAADAEACYQYAKDPRVGPIAGWPAHTSVEQSREIIRTILSAPETYAIVWKETMLPIGSIGLHHNDLAEQEDEAELGYWLGVPWWGRGIVPEAAQELLRHAFEDLKLERVWCAYYEGNEKSRRVQEKLGFRHQWTTENLPVPQLGETRTGYVNLMIREDWLSSRKV